MNFAIIGAGFFGLSTAIKIKEKYPKSKVTIFERENDILLGASGKNQFRCHRGYHYPRSEETIQECLESFGEFNKYFSDTFLKSENYYAIAEKNSLTDFDKYLKILKRNKLKYKIETSPLLKSDQIQGLVKVDEKLINIYLIKKKFIRLIKEHNILLKLNHHFILCEENMKNYDCVFLCTYDQNNKNLKLNYKIDKKFYYQLVEKIIVKTPKVYSNKSFVILDGPFMCIDPYIYSNQSILGSVKSSVIDKILAKDYDFKKYFKNINSQYYRHIPEKKFKDIKKKFCDFFYGFEKTQYLKSFIVIRCTIKNKKDERITRITNEKNLFKVFSGKWVNCMLTAKKILKQI